MTRAFILRLLESYFRHRWLNLLPIVLMVAAGAGYVITKPREYTTQGLIYVPGNSYLATLTNVSIDPANPWVSPAQGTANEIKELLQTDSFIRSIILKTDLAPQLGGTPKTVEQLIKDARKAAWATTAGDNQVVVGTLHKNPVIAFQIASATIENYTQWRIDANLAQSSVAQTFFADLVQKYAAEVDTARQALSQYLLQHPGPVTGNRLDVEQIEINRLQADLNQAQARLTAALDKQENARLAASQVTVSTRQALYVLDAPTIPDQPTTSLKQSATQGGLFAAVGLLVTLVSIVGGAILDRSFLIPLDVTVQLDLPVLATIPDVTPRRRWFRRDLEPVPSDAVRWSTAMLPRAFRYRPNPAAAGNKLAAPSPAGEPSQSSPQSE